MGVFCDLESTRSVKERGESMGLYSDSYYYCMTCGNHAIVSDADLAPVLPGIEQCPILQCGICSGRQFRVVGSMFCSVDMTFTKSNGFYKPLTTDVLIVPDDERRLPDKVKLPMNLYSETEPLPVILAITVSRDEIYDFQKLMDKSNTMSYPMVEFVFWHKLSPVEYEYVSIPYPKHRYSRVHRSISLIVRYVDKPPASLFQPPAPREMN